jgi:hypothetical protein
MSEIIRECLCLSYQDLLEKYESERIAHEAKTRELEETKETLRQAKRWIESVEKFGADTKKELEDLQDAIEEITYKKYESHYGIMRRLIHPGSKLFNAIEASRQRAKEKQG